MENKVNCPVCGTELEENSYHRAIEKGAKYYCWDCDGINKGHLRADLSVVNLDL